MGKKLPVWSCHFHTGYKIGKWVSYRELLLMGLPIRSQNNPGPEIHKDFLITGQLNATLCLTQVKFFKFSNSKGGFINK